MNTTLSAGASMLAPAKINLALHVTGRRSDGYHLLDMLVSFADYGDLIHVERSEHDDFTVSGHFSDGIPLDSGNLVLKARDALRQTFGAQLPPVRIHLEKNLPIASGIGGGSSDAAATLLALNTLWQLNLDFQTLATLGLILGADLPMCLHGTAYGTPLIARGIGEDLTPAPFVPSLPMLLINDGTAIGTPDVFRALVERNNAPLPCCTQTMPNSVEDLCAYLSSTRNDLLPAALHVAPAITAKLALIRSYEPLYAQMSGSGATCFAIFKDQQSVELAEKHIRNQHPDWFIVSTKTGGAHR